MQPYFGPSAERSALGPRDRLAGDGNERRMTALDSGWIAALASVISALIIAVTALVAFLQLRHFRNANDIVVYLRLVDHMDSPEMQAGRQGVAAVAATIATDPGYLERLADPTFIPDDFRNVGALLRTLEHMSVLVAKGGIAEHLVLAEYADTFVAMWDHLRPAILQRRTAFGPQTGRAFEHLAMRARKYIDSGQMQREYDALERDLRPLT
jgi:hypothetical protein